MAKSRNAVKMLISDRIFMVIVTSILLLVLFLMIYPFWNVFMTSISDQELLRTMGNVSFLPRGFSMEGYRLLFQNNMLLRYYANTVTYALTGTAFLLIVSSLTGYALSVKTFCLRKVMMTLMIITMYVSGGLIPSYLLIRKLGWFDTLWVMTVPGALSVYNCIVFKTFFQQIPDELKEAAFLDGANDLQLLIRIILPLSKALLATFAIFSIVGFWNGWFDALVYLRDTSRYPIQNYLRSLLVNMETLASDTMSKAASQARMTAQVYRVVRGAAIVVTTLPIMMVYPFFQKYFAKGVIVGSLKG